MVDWRRTLTAPRRWWWGSLPLRVVVATIASATIILVLGGVLLMQQATDGVLQAKRAAVLAESQSALEYARGQLDSTTDTSDSVDQRLTQVAYDVAQRGLQTGQYEVIVQSRAARIQPHNVLASDPVPDSLRAEMSKSTSTQTLWVTPTSVRYVDGRPDVPGLVVGALVEPSPGVEATPIYFVFPLTSEVKTLSVLQNAVLTVGILLAALLALLSYVVARLVVSPVRRAALSAERLASGHLDERLPVRGTDDLAVLGTSMNNMASELEKQITSYEDLSRVQQRFVSDVSHELRTPLTTVRMAAEVLYDGRDEFDAVEHRSAEILHDELDRFEGLLADLLEISRFDAGAAVLTTEETSLADVVRAEVEAQRPFAERMGTPLALTVVGDTTGEMDARRIRRVLRNLITNAIEHGEGKPIAITVAGDAETLAVTVRDHGVGFEAAQASKVFGRFWRADPARTRTVGGTGLGLAISIEDARLHGGWLHAWGRPGQGAKFRLTLPRERGEAIVRSPLMLAPEAGE